HPSGVLQAQIQSELPYAKGKGRTVDHLTCSPTILSHALLVNPLRRWSLRTLSAHRLCSTSDCSTRLAHGNFPNGQILCGGDHHPLPCATFQRRPYCSLLLADIGERTSGRPGPVKYCTRPRVSGNIIPLRLRRGWANTGRSLRTYSGNRPLHARGDPLPAFSARVPYP